MRDTCVLLFFFADELGLLGVEVFTQQEVLSDDLFLELICLAAELLQFVYGLVWGIAWLHDFSDYKCEENNALFNHSNPNFSAETS